MHAQHTGGDFSLSSCSVTRILRLQCVAQHSVDIQMWMAPIIDVRACWQRQQHLLRTLRGEYVSQEAVLRAMGPPEAIPARHQTNGVNSGATRAPLGP